MRAVLRVIADGDVAPHAVGDRSVVGVERHLGPGHPIGRPGQQIRIWSRCRGVSSHGDEAVVAMSHGGEHPTAGQAVHQDPGVAECLILERRSRISGGSGLFAPEDAEQQRCERKSGRGVSGRARVIRRVVASSTRRRSHEPADHRNRKARSHGNPRLRRSRRGRLEGLDRKRAGQALVGTPRLYRAGGRHGRPRRRAIAGLHARARRNTAGRTCTTPGPTARSSPTSASSSSSTSPTRTATSSTRRPWVYRPASRTTSPTSSPSNPPGTAVPR